MAVSLHEAPGASSEFFPAGRKMAPTRTGLVALLLAGVLVQPVAAEETWCWARDVDAPRSSWACVYTLAQCRGIVRVRRAGICVPAHSRRAQQGKRYHPV